MIDRIDKAIVILVLLTGISLAAAGASACDIKMSVEEGTGGPIAAGDTVSVKVTVMFTHRDCAIGIEETAFETNGVEIVGSTEWTEIKARPRTMEKMLSLAVTRAGKGEVSIKAYRICDLRSGGETTLILIPKETGSEKR